MPDYCRCRHAEPLLDAFAVLFFATLICMAPLMLLIVISLLLPLSLRHAGFRQRGAAASCCRFHFFDAAADIIAASITVFFRRY